MNSKWLKVRTFVCAVAAIGWWGLWYPEIAEYAGAYTVVEEDGTVQDDSEVIECESDESVYREWFKMDTSQIRFRSRLWQLAEEYLEKVRS